MKSAKKLARVVLAIVITVAIAGTASARGMSHEVVEPAALEAGPVYRTPSLEIHQPLQAEILGRLPSIDMGIFPPGDAGKTPAHTVPQPLQVEILGKAPAIDFGFHPSAGAHRSGIQNVFPIQPDDGFFGRLPSIDMGIFPPGDAGRTRAHAVAQPLQVDIVRKNPTEAVKQPPQCDVICMKNPTEAVKQPPQCEAVCMKNPTEAVKQPLQCDVCTKNPTEAVKQPLQCDDVCLRNPTEAVKQPLQCDVCTKNPTEAVKQPPQCDTCGRTPYEAVREPLSLECFGPTMRFTMKEDSNAEIAIYNVNGRLVRRLTARLSSGESTITWDGKDDRGGRAASGVYFARVQANEQAGKGKLVVVR